MNDKLEKLSDEEIKEIARRERNEYQRRWRKENKDKIKEINMRYWAKKGLERQEGEREG